MTFSSLVLADVSLTAVIWWIVVGLIAGFLASLVMRGGGFGRGGFHVVRFNGGRFRGAMIAGRTFRAGFRNGFRAGLIAGNSRSATTGSGTSPVVVQCLTPDCSMWHSYRD